MSDTLSTRMGFPRLVVRDLQKEAAFYRAAFGYGEGIFIKDKLMGRGIEEIIFMTGEGKAELVLLQFMEGPQPSSDGAMLGYFTSDLDAFAARVTGAGGTIAQEPVLIDMGTRKARMGVYADPEGFLLEVIED